MAFEELKRDLIEADADVRSYLENSEEYFRLKVFKVLMGIITTASQSLLIGALALLALFLLSLAASIALNLVFDSPYLGYVILGTAYVLLAIICYFLKDRFNAPLFRKFSKRYFD
ncbi:MAG: hypothetical protein MUO53_04445 [Maribacter sp.]|nr:hypothetical protein [Maribacter sp.]